MILYGVCINTWKSARHRTIQANTNGYGGVFSLMPDKHWVSGSNPAHIKSPPPTINNHPTYYNCNVNKFGVPSWTDYPCSRKTLGFPTEDNTGKLLLKRMASDH